MILVTSVAVAATCDSYGEPAVVTSVGSVPIAESSGLAASRTRDGVFFTHGDHGDEALIVAFDRRGNVVGEHLVKDATNEDWEDIAAGPCPDEGDCVYVGDIGDNDEERPNVVVYVVREPPEKDEKVATIARYVGVYPDAAHDAEALMIHPCSGEVYVVTKDPDGASVVFKFPAFPEDTVTLERVADLAIAGPQEESREVTGGDWDLDGERVVLRTSDRLFWWPTDPDAPDAHWGTPPNELVGTTEFNGEGVAFGLDGDIYTTGEDKPVALSAYPCEGEAPAEGECEPPQTGRRCGCASGPGPAGALGAAALLVLTARRAAPRGRPVGRR